MGTFIRGRTKSLNAPSGAQQPFELVRGRRRDDVQRRDAASPVVLDEVLNVPPLLFSRCRTDPTRTRLRYQKSRNGAAHRFPIAP